MTSSNSRAERPVAAAAVKIYRTPGGGVHIAARFDGDPKDVHAEIGPVTSQLAAMRAAAALATSTLGQRLRQVLGG